jgi:adenylate kinase
MKQETSQHPMYVVLLGAPGAGQGTQAAQLCEALDIAHVSSGELFREHLGNETELGVLAKSYMDQGELVPDDITIAMVMDRLSRPDCRDGAILDGFPRTLPQAEALDRALAKTLLARLGGRWTCRQCGTVYHQPFSPPKVEGVCDVCGGTLYQRPDDTPATHKRRIDVYVEQTQPVIDHYRKIGVLVEVDGERDVGTVYSALLAAIQEAT